MGFPPLGVGLGVLSIATGVPFLLLFLCFVSALSGETSRRELRDGFVAYWKFFYGSFIKPHSRDASKGQQGALESFYNVQADAYDITRSRLLKGREDMLSLAAAQLVHRASREPPERRKRIWVDVGGGTGYNIEAMSAFLDVPDFFHCVYLVDLSPSLCAVARKRFEKLGWKNIKVICEDARAFRLEDFGPERKSHDWIDSSEAGVDFKADLVTLSYSLSMIPDFYTTIDSLSSLICPTGVIAVTDFYVQSAHEITGRNYSGGLFDRHVNWLGRLFWRAWFDVDRVNLDSGRRDYLEYRFGTIMSINRRNYRFGGIPYYTWIGCQRYPNTAADDYASVAAEALERLDASATESPGLSPVLDQVDLERSPKTRATVSRVRSKLFDVATANLAYNLPLPSFFYQNHHWRLHYDDQLAKHTQFNNEYIYAYTWEDPKVDKAILNITSEDVILAITSAGDNILSYALERPRRIHAVDLNPAQNHLLELKVASFTALGHADVWKLFGEGKHTEFRTLLLSKLSPHLSSPALQFWLDQSSVFTNGRKGGLYDTGGSRHAMRAVKWLFRAFGLSGEITRLCKASTLQDQHRIWRSHVRAILLSKTLSWAVVGQEKFLWKALGVPTAQRDMIVRDYLQRQRKDGEGSDVAGSTGLAIWNYVVDTLDPVIEHTLLRDDNYFYSLVLQGRYTKLCHPEYLSAAAHTTLSHPSTALSTLQIHTDSLSDVLSRLSPSRLTIAVIMDSMDWFSPSPAVPSPAVAVPTANPSAPSLLAAASPAAQQIAALHRALRPGGRVLLRSAALRPWYLDDFESRGFVARRVSERRPGRCVDRVNMYASCWVCTKVLEPLETIVEAGGEVLDGEMVVGAEEKGARVEVRELELEVGVGEVVEPLAL